MKVALPIDSSQVLGGGFSFRRNLAKALGNFPEVQVVDTIQESDICLIASPSMVTKETIELIKSSGKKLVVRLDNVPRNSRNRNTGTSRLKSFSEKADALVWQCSWAREYLEDFVGRKDGIVIYNGVDTDIFKPDGDKTHFGDENDICLYSRYNRDETKNWEVAWFDYQMRARDLREQGRTSRLVIVGQFSPEQIEYNFDFFRGETIQYIGIMERPEEMAKVYRGVNNLFATYFNDCYSNTYLEALCCGVDLISVSLTGGTKELVDNYYRGLEWNGLKRMGQDYVDLFKKLV